MSLRIIRSLFYSLCYLKFTLLLLPHHNYQSGITQVLFQLYIQTSYHIFTFLNSILRDLFSAQTHNPIQVLQYLFLALTLLLVREKIQHRTSNNNDDTVTVGDRGSTVVKVRCATNRKINGSIPDGVIALFH